MALKAQDQIEDYFQDEVGQCLILLHSHPTWNGVKSRLFEHLMDITKRERYLSFTGDFRDYHLQRKGQSCLYDVPQSQQGALVKFRGKRIRLICAGGWDQYAGRFFLARQVLNG